MELRKIGILVVAGVGLWGCNRTSKPGDELSAQPFTPAPAPVLGEARVHPPEVEEQRPGPDSGMRRDIPEETATRTIPAGTTIQIRINEAISRGAAPGEIFSGVVTRDVEGADKRVAIPRGANASLLVLRGNVLDLAGLQIAGRRFRLEGRKATPLPDESPAQSSLRFHLDSPVLLRAIH